MMTEPLTDDEIERLRPYADGCTECLGYGRWLATVDDLRASLDEETGALAGESAELRRSMDREAALRAEVERLRPTSDAAPRTIVNPHHPVPGMPGAHRKD